MATHNATLNTGGPGVFSYAHYRWVAGGEPVLIGDGVRAYIETLTLPESTSPLFTIVEVDPDAEIVLPGESDGGGGGGVTPVGFEEGTIEVLFDEVADVSQFASQTIRVAIPAQRFVVTRVELQKVGGTFNGNFSGSFYAQVVGESMSRQLEPQMMWGADAFPIARNNGEMVFSPDAEVEWDWTLETNIFGPIGETLQVRAVITYEAFVEAS